MRILDCKSPVCQELVQGAPDDAGLPVRRLQRRVRTALKANLDAMGIEYAVDPGIVRGLDYYTKTAFEFVTTKIGAQGTVCGGGRYDHLVEEIGGPATPGVGFGLGKERLLLTMEACGAEIPAAGQAADVFIAFMGDDAKAAGLKLLHDSFRQEGCQRCRWTSWAGTSRTSSNTRTG